MKKTIFLALITLVAVAFACSKDEVAPTKTELITKGKWYITKAEAKTSDFTFDISATFIEDCENDDYYEFDANGTFIKSVGSDKCDNEVSASGTWSFTENETVLNITFTGLTPMAFDLISINTKNLKVSNDETVSIEGSDLEVELIRTYTHN